MIIVFGLFFFSKEALQLDCKVADSVSRALKVTTVLIKTAKAIFCNINTFVP